MSDVFLKEDVGNLLLNKFVVILGDSIQRGVYKDLILALQSDNFLTDAHLRAKGELNFVNDNLLEGGRKGKMSNGISYREVRQFQSNYHLLRFYFVTRCYNNYVQMIIEELVNEPKPDLVVMNSCLWDMTRYGPDSIPDYKENLNKLLSSFQKHLPKSCLIIWNTTLPISKVVRGGFLVPEVEHMSSTLRLDILEANSFAHGAVVAHGFDVVDMHYYMRYNIHRRVEDGVHWNMTAHRRMTNLLLTHVAEAWQMPPPGRVNSLLSGVRLPEFAAVWFEHPKASNSELPSSFQQGSRGGEQSAPRKSKSRKKRQKSRKAKNSRFKPY